MSQRPNEARRLMVADIARFPVHDGNEIVHLRGAGSNFLVPAPVAGLIASCSSFLTATEHATAFAAKVGARPEDVPQLAAALDGFAEEGLLVDLDAVATAGRATPKPPPITTLAFVTRDRPALLERAIRSYVANASAHGRSPSVLVCDDAADPRTRAAARLNLAHLRDDLAAPIAYVGEEEKRAFADALANESGVHRDVVDFALFDVAGCGATFGANRNAMLLLTCGELVLAADDDTVCRPATAPDPRGGVALVGESDPQQYWFFDDIATALESGIYVDADVLGEHERLLGWTLASLVASEGSDVTGVCPHMLDGLSTGRGRVALTQGGILGDSGMHSGGSFLATRGATRQRLLASEAAYRSALHSRAILRAPERPSVGHGPQLAGTVFGIDNRTPLVPFPPVLRNEDGGFSGLLHRCFEDAYFGYPAIATVHAPETPRSFAPSAYLDAASQVRFCDVLQAVVQTWPGSPLAPGPARVRALGNHLVDVASQSASDFQGLTRHALALNASVSARGYGAALRDFAKQPTFWANDVHELLARRADAVTSSSSFWLPSDLRPGRSDEEVAALTQRLVRSFGALLAAWDALFAAAPAAKARAGLLSSSRFGAH
jgi:hypothetical protein